MSTKHNAILTDDETDSGFVTDFSSHDELLTEAFDVLPDERTLSIDFLELDLDLSNENFGPSIEDEVFQEPPQTEKNVSSNPLDSKLPTPPISVTLKNKEQIPREDQRLPGKYTEFTKEQARQWRRKRILNTTRPQLKPLLPLPDKLKPLKNKPPQPPKVPVEEKLKDPLLGGERVRANRAPVPMKLRALPQSFWVEPKTSENSSLAGNHYSVLPPLFSPEMNSDVHNIRPVTPPEEKGKSPRHSPRHKKKVVASEQVDTELLFSLFDHLENKIDERLIVKRGRPKKLPSERRPQQSRDKTDDPCIVDAIADRLFPELSLQQAKENSQNLAAVIKIGKGKTSVVELPAIKQDYSSMLNELVTHM